MELISNYLSKPVISIYEASIIGTVINITFDKKMKRVCSLLIVSDTDEDEALYAIPISRIMTVDNALTIKNGNSVTLYEESNIFVRSPINHPVYLTTGEKKGIVQDVAFDEKSFEVIELCLDNEKIPAAKVASVSNTLVILKGEGFVRVQAPRAKRERKFIPSEHIEKSFRKDYDDEGERADYEEEYEELKNQYTYEKANKVFISKEEGEEDEKEPYVEVLNQNSRGKISMPARIISDYSFLLNRKVLQDVYNTMGELIIPANTVITAETVETARRCGKLVELTIGSRLMGN